MRNNNRVIGLILVVLGGLLLLNNLDIINIRFRIFDMGFIFGRLWPLLFLIIPGLMMHRIFFSGKTPHAGILVPAGILLTNGVICQICMLIPSMWAILWPGFILAVAVGLFELYLFGGKEKALLIPVVILGGLSLIFFNAFSIRLLFGAITRRLFIPAVILGIGLFVLLRRPGKNDGF